MARKDTKAVRGDLFAALFGAPKKDPRRRVYEAELPDGRRHPIAGAGGSGWECFELLRGIEYPTLRELRDELREQYGARVLVRTERV